MHLIRPNNFTESPFSALQPNDSLCIKLPERSFTTILEAATDNMNYSAFIAAAPCVLHRHANRRAMQVATPRTTPYASAVPRRTALKLTVALAAALLVPGSPAKAAAKGSDPALGERFDNRDFGYSFIPPGAGWSKEVATLSAGRAATIFLREADGDTNVNMVTTPVSSDFQKLSSFGTMEKVLVR